MSHGSPVPSLLALVEGDVLRQPAAMGGIGPAATRSSQMAACDDPGPFSIKQFTSGTPAGGWSQVVYGNGVWVGIRNVSSTTSFMRSTDGITWTAQTTASFQPGAVTFGNGLFVAVSSFTSTTSVMTSPDGITWTSRTTPNQNAVAVCFGNGLFVAVGSINSTANIMTSSDGVTWTARTGAKAEGCSSIAYGAGVYCIAHSGSTTTSVSTSTDAITWTTRTTPNANTHVAIIYGNGLFVIAEFTGTGNRATTSPDGITWTARTTPTTDLPYGAIAYGNGLFVAVAGVASTSNNVLQGTAMVSTDGITWRMVNLEGNPGGITFAAYGNGQWIFPNGGQNFYGAGAGITTCRGTQPYAVRESSALVVVPTAASTITAPDGCGVLILKPAGLLATLTVVLPANPGPWETFVLCAENFGVTTLTLTGSMSTGAGITTIAAGGFAKWIWEAAGSNWVRMG